MSAGAGLCGQLWSISGRDLENAGWRRAQGLPATDPDLALFSWL